MIRFRLQDMVAGGSRFNKVAILQQVTRPAQSFFRAFNLTCHVHCHISTAGPQATSTIVVQNKRCLQRKSEAAGIPAFPGHPLTSESVFPSDVIGKAQADCTRTRSGGAKLTVIPVFVQLRTLIGQIVSEEFNPPLIP